MRVLAIIPARAGSKRLPGKNIKLLARKPLIAHAINAVIQSNCYNLVVSTDSQEIADIVVQHGGSVPWLKPAILSVDSTIVEDTLNSFLNNYKKINVFFCCILLIQNTSHFRKPEIIRKVALMYKEVGEEVVSINKVSFKLSRCRTIDNQGNLYYPNVFKIADVSEESESIYKLKGAIYIATTKQLITNKSFYTDPTKALLMDSPIESIDIDTPIDWALTEKLMELNQEALV
ncbi:TPA: acylneuraminate cytidylyltransferase family protein [Legionella pneumophila]|nr:acylneuraminate cytidylyltransferase family protein [Legionella pneumophila subsp. fraseri]HAT1771273.1 acylneuraminate cytidylyltransferase family protein [Legionella pneumophila]HAT2128236.1 acylneuraminate cytidylyltransferase family protein [Legionella pneumophila]HAT2135181.1 acylneuraminate cytidylyltransferase family protein [Legionella pneumophila]HAT2141300.1 acylneuraminate cytidylyltransferase family protein [Legionella pneumophila]